MLLIDNSYSCVFDESLLQIRYDIRNLEGTLKTVERQKNEMEAALQEKEIKLSRSTGDVKHLQEKLDSMEMIHRKELETQKERVSSIYYLQVLCY